MWPLLNIPVIAGFSLEVYFILIILGIPVYFVCRRFLKESKNRRILTWISTITITPIFYTGLVMLFLFFTQYYPNRDFDSKGWLANKDQRYEYSADIIKSKMLIGKTKDEVRKILGYVRNSNNNDEWYYDLGYIPEIGNIDPDILVINFQNGKVISVKQRHT